MKNMTWSIGRKLAVGFAAVIILTIAVGAIGLFALNRVKTEVETTTTVGARLETLSNLINISLLDALLNEKEFFLYYKSKGIAEAKAEYVSEVQSQVAAIHTYTTEGLRLEPHEEDAANFRQVETLIDNYETGYLQSVALVEQRGHVDTGLEGQFHAKIQEMETAAEEAKLDQLTIDILAIRRREKDYLLRGGEDYISQVVQSVAQFKQDLSASKLSPADQTRLSTLTDEYLALFQQLTQIDADLATAIEGYHESAHQIEPIVAKIRAAATEEFQASVLNANQMISTANVLEIAALALAILLGFGIAILLSRSISRPVGQLTEAARKLAIGDVNQTIKIQSRDEIGVMANAFSQMITYQQQMAGVAGRLAQGDVTANITPQSDKDTLGNAFSQMITYQQQMAGVAGRLAQGDVTVNITPQSDKDVLGNAFSQMIAYQQQMAGAAGRLAQGDIVADVTPQSDKDVLGNAFSQMIVYQQQMAEAAGRLAQGDLTTNITPQSDKDGLGNAFSLMIANLRNLISQVADTADTVGAASSQLATAANQAGQASQQVTSTIQQIAQGTTQQTQSVSEVTNNSEQMARAADGIATGAQEQAQGVQKTAGLVGEMANIVDQVGQVSRAVSEANVKVTQAARHSVTAVGQTSQGMDTIRVRAITAADKVKEMSNRSKEIGRIVETIDDIADKTDMLALNAAVEAARAGEHGRGFAVVADQVRKLSEDSKGATRDIAELIERVQETVREAIGAMESTVIEVDNGTRLAGDTARSLEEILLAAEGAATLAEQIDRAVSQLRQKSEGVVAAMEAVSAIVEENTAVAEEMAAGSQQVMQAMEGVSSVAEENSASAEEVSASAEEMAAQVEEVVASADELSSLAEQLQAAVAQFQVDEAGPTQSERPGRSWEATRGSASRQRPMAVATPVDRQGNGYANQT